MLVDQTNKFTPLTKLMSGSGDFILVSIIILKTNKWQIWPVSVVSKGVFPKKKISNSFGEKCQKSVPLSGVGRSPLQILKHVNVGCLKHGNLQSLLFFFVVFLGSQKLFFFSSRRGQPRLGHPFWTFGRKCPSTSKLSSPLKLSSKDDGGSNSQEETPNTLVFSAIFQQLKLLSNL